MRSEIASLGLLMSGTPKPVVNVLVALSCEAKPLVDFYRLSKASSSPFAYFISSSKSPDPFILNLVVSGVGAVNMAAACGWLAATTSDHVDSGWLNCGVAGHAKLPIGEIARVVGSADLVTERTHYPPLVARWSGKCVSLTTYATPSTDYPHETAVDLEASGFFATARRFASSELVQSLKIISDNQQSDLKQLDSARISQLIAARMNEISAFVNGLVELLPETPKVGTARADIEHLHCTASQLQQYLDLVNKLDNVGIGDAIVSGKSRSAGSMQELLADLRNLQQQTPPVLAESPGLSKRHS